MGKPSSCLYMAEKSKKTELVLAGQVAMFTTSISQQPQKDTAREKPVKMKDHVAKESGNRKWAYYGENDDFPSVLREKMGLVSLIKRGLSFNADAHFGAGIRWFKEEYTEEKVIKRPVLIPKWVQMVTRTGFNVVMGDVIETLEHFYWVPVRVVTNLAKTRIDKLEVLDPVFTRIGKRNDKGEITHVYFSYLYPDSPPDNDIVEYPIYDPKNPQKYSEFVILLKYSTFGSVYYPEPDYYSVFRNGWVDVACAVPAFIKAMYTKSASIKYHVHIPEHYFPLKYKDWETKTAKERLDIVTKEKTDMDTFLMGQDNAHKVFVSIFGLDSDGKEMPDWKIEPIQDYLKKDAELPNNSAANSEILFAMGVDASLVGFGIPGGKDLSGSGSDKRMSMAIKQSLMQRERCISLQLPIFIANFEKMTSGDEFPLYLDINTQETLNENRNGTPKTIATGNG